MNEVDIIKGVETLKAMAENLKSVIVFCENNNISEMFPFTEQMQNSCSILTDIMEKAFTNMIAEKERLEDDGK